MALDLFWSPMGKYRGYLSLTVTPVQWFVDVPNRTIDFIDHLLVDRDSLLEDNQRLEADLLIMARKLQRLQFMNAENSYLRDLLSSSEKVDERVELTELIGVNPNPFIHQIIINKGLSDDVYLGQPVLDSTGVMGQVVEVGPYTSRVLLITDTQHAIPVEVTRGGFRSLLLGKGSADEMLLDHVPDTSGVKVGDVLISSGLGQRFPRGYPVAEVTAVEHHPGYPFATVKAKPTAHLNQSRQLLLVFKQGSEQPLPEFELDFEIGESN